MAIKLSYEPAVTATVTAGIATAAGVAAALNAADMPDGWGWMETWVPVGIFLVYLLVGLVIRPLVIPAKKAADQVAAERLTPAGPPSNVRPVGGYTGGEQLLPPPGP